MSLTPIPTLDAIAADPARAAGLPAEARQVLMLRALAALAALATLPACQPAPAPETDRLLDAREAAARLGMTPDWLYRRAPRLPFTVRLGRALRFSAAGIDRYIRARQGR